MIIDHGKGANSLEFVFPHNDFSVSKEKKKKKRTRIKNIYYIFFKQMRCLIDQFVDDAHRPIKCVPIIPRAHVYWKKTSWSQ